jgi:hypothetical protein
MHDRFPDWYHQVALDPSPERLAARWEGVTATRSGASVSSALDLVRLAINRDAVAETRDVLVETFRATDPNFPSVDNDMELRILASSAVVELINAGGDKGTASALAVLNGVFAGASPVLTELETYAEEYVQREGVRVRSRESIEVAVTASPFKKATDVFKDTMDSGVVGSTVVEALTAAGNEMKRVESLLQQVASVVPDVALAEEVDILWWLLGEHAHGVDQPFETLDAAAAPLILAENLASRTRLLPGPPAADALLRRALALANADGAEVTIQAVVDACPIEWRKGLSVEASDRHDFAPVLESVRRSVETEGHASWADAAQHALQLNLKSKHAPSALAAEGYREFLLVRIAEAD